MSASHLWWPPQPSVLLKRRLWAPITSHHRSSIGFSSATRVATQELSRPTPHAQSLCHCDGLTRLYFARLHHRNDYCQQSGHHSRRSTNVEISPQQSVVLLRRFQLESSASRERERTVSTQGRRQRSASGLNMKTLESCQYSIAHRRLRLLFALFLFTA